MNIHIIGNKSCGKSSIANAIANESISNITLRNGIYIISKYSYNKDIRNPKNDTDIPDYYCISTMSNKSDENGAVPIKFGLNIFDNPGFDYWYDVHKQFEKVLLNNFAQPDCIVFVTDVEDKFNIELFTFIKKKIDEHNTGDHNINLFIVVNKYDSDNANNNMIYNDICKESKIGRTNIFRCSCMNATANGLAPNGDRDDFVRTLCTLAGRINITPRINSDERTVDLLLNSDPTLPCSWPKINLSKPEILSVIFENKSMLNCGDKKLASVFALSVKYGWINVMNKIYNLLPTLIGADRYRAVVTIFLILYTNENKLNRLQYQTYFPNVEIHKQILSYICENPMTYTYSINNPHTWGYYDLSTNAYRTFDTMKIKMHMNFNMDSPVLRCMLAVDRYLWQILLLPNPLHFIFQLCMSDRQIVKNLCILNKITVEWEHDTFRSQEIMDMCYKYFETYKYNIVCDDEYTGAWHDLTKEMPDILGVDLHEKNPYTMRIMENM